jgi:hypothetical protein
MWCFWISFFTEKMDRPTPVKAEQAWMIYMVTADDGDNGVVILD